MPRRSGRKAFKKQEIVTPPTDLSDYEDVPLTQEICSSVDDDSCQDVDDDDCEETVKQEESDEDVQPWTATSRKRKEIFRHTNAHLQPLAKTGGFTSRMSAAPASMPPAPKKARYLVKPSGRAPGSSSRSSSSSSSSSSTNPSINWAERKAQLAESDNIAFIDPLVSALLEIFHDVARDVRGGDLSKTGPTFLWGLVPAFVKAIEDTPWGYWSDIRREGEKSGMREYVVFVNWPWGTHAADLSASQVKFRQACIMKVIVLFEDQAQTFMSNPDIKVICSKNFGANASFVR
jgi:hypothetical protein